MALTATLTTASATSAALGWAGGRSFVKAAGTWGGGTLTLTWCESDTGTFAPIGTGVSLTADGSKGFEIGKGYLKATLSGSTGATVNLVIASLWAGDGQNS